MKKNIFAIILVFALLAGFASCKRLPQDYEVEGSDSSAQSGLQNSAGGDSTSEVTFAPEMQSFLDTFNDPESMEELLETDVEVPELEFGEDLIDDSKFDKVEVEVNNEGKPVHDNAKKNYEKIVEGETFTMDVVIKSKVNGEEMTIPLLVIRDGKNLYFETKMPVDNKGSMKFNFILNEDGNCYIVIPAMRAYMSIPKEYVGDLLPSDFVTEEFTAAYVESGEVEIGGKTYICDVYQDGDVITKNYFYDDELKRIETVSGEDVTIIEINDINDKADSTKFKLPKNYFDITTVMGSSVDLSTLA